MLSDDELNEAVACFNFATAGFCGAMDRAAKTFATFGRALAAATAETIDQMNANEFERYRQLRSMGVLPLDAAALLTATDDELAAHLENVKD